MQDNNPNPWIEYQPDRDRDKEIYDIELRNGTIVQGCYPNGVCWNPMYSHKYPTPKGIGKGSIADYRVVRIRRTYPDPFNEVD